MFIMCNSMCLNSVRQDLEEIDQIEDCVDYFNDPTRFYHYAKNFGFHTEETEPLPEEEIGDLLEWLYNVNP
jgi:hypothetical protein